MSWQTPENLSADEVVRHLGTTGGTANARTLSGSTLTLAAGLRVSFVSHTTNSGAVTLDIGEGSGALPVYFPSFAVPNQPANLSASQLFTGLPVLAEYSASGYWVVVSALPLGAGNIPSTLNATTFGGQITQTSGYFQPAANQGILSGTTTASVNIGTGTNWSQAGNGGAFATFFPNGHATKPGDAEYYCGSASGAAHSFFDKNGVEKLIVNEDGVISYGATYLGDNVQSYGSNYSLGFYIISNTQAIMHRAGSSFAGGAGSLIYGIDHATYPGAHQQFAPLSTRAASTAFAVCPVATGDSAVVELFSGSGNGIQVVIHVDSTGTVTLHDPDGVAYNTAYTVTSSPAASYIGIYWSAGVLYIKPGSDFTGGSAIKLATFSKIAKA